MCSVRMSQLEHVTEHIWDGKGTLTCSTTAVSEAQSAVRTYGEQVQGKFVRAFEGRAGRTHGEGSDCQGEDRVDKAVESAKGVGAKTAAAARGWRGAGRRQWDQRSRFKGGGGSAEGEK